MSDPTFPDYIILSDGESDEEIQPSLATMPHRAIKQEYQAQHNVQLQQPGGYPPQNQGGIFYPPQNQGGTVYPPQNQAGIVYPPQNQAGIVYPHGQTMVNARAQGPVNCNSLQHNVNHLGFRPTNANIAFPQGPPNIISNLRAPSYNGNAHYIMQPGFQPYSQGAISNQGPMDAARVRHFHQLNLQALPPPATHSSLHGQQTSKATTSASTSGQNVQSSNYPASPPWERNTNIQEVAQHRERPPSLQPQTGYNMKLPTVNSPVSPTSPLNNGHGLTNTYNPPCPLLPNQSLPSGTNINETLNTPGQATARPNSNQIQTSASPLCGQAPLNNVQNINQQQQFTANEVQNLFAGFLNLMTFGLSKNNPQPGIQNSNLVEMQRESARRHTPLTNVNGAGRSKDDNRGKGIMPIQREAKSKNQTIISILERHTSSAAGVITSAQAIPKVEIQNQTFDLKPQSGRQEISSKGGDDQISSPRNSLLSNTRKSSCTLGTQTNPSGTISCTKLNPLVISDDEEKPPINADDSKPQNNSTSNEIIMHQTNSKSRASSTQGEEMHSVPEVVSGPTEVDDGETESEDSGGPYQCEPCGQTLHSHGDLVKHMMHKHVITVGKYGKSGSSSCSPTLQTDLTTPDSSVDAYTPPQTDQVSPINSSTVASCVQTPTSAVRYVCDTCNRCFKHHTSLQRHLPCTMMLAKPRRVYGNGSFKCPYAGCKSMLASKAGLRQHIKGVHVGKAAKVHRKSGKSQNKSVRSQRKAFSKPHQNALTAKDRLFAFACVKCRSGFPYAEDFRGHKCAPNRNPTGKRLTDVSYVCKICGRRFINRAGLTNHAPSHEKNNKMLHCSMCDIYLASQSFYGSHVKQLHRGNHSTVVAITNKTVSHKKRNLISASPRPKDENFLAGTKVNFNLLSMKYRCDLCRRGFINDQRLFHHENRCEGYNFRCSSCRSGFSYKEDLVEHRRECNDKISLEVKGVYACKACEMTFAWKASLTRHAHQHRLLETQTKKEKSFQCKSCNLYFLSQRSFSEHVYVYHRKRVRKATAKVASTTDDDTNDMDTADCTYDQIQSLLSSSEMIPRDDTTKVRPTSSTVSVKSDSTVLCLDDVESLDSL